MNTDVILVERASLRRELILGRIVMIGFIGIFLFRELWSVEVEASTVRITVIISSAVLALTWAWFWAFVAAGPNRVAAGLAVGLMVASAGVLVHVNHIGVFPFYYAVIVAGTAYKWQASAVLVVLVTAVTLAVWWPQGQTDADALQVCGITALLGGAAITVRRFIGAQIELDATRDELRRLAAVEARIKLARDLHDRLGQQLTVSIMQAELLVMDLNAGSIEDARTRSHLVVSTSRGSLDLMREIVSDAREPDLHSEVALAEQVLASSGIACHVRLGSGDVPATADQVLGWIIREGVTNVLRHSGAATCDITVTTAKDAVSLKIEDDGRGIGSLNGGGMGLGHMRERLAAVGGSISLTDGPHGGATLVAIIRLS